MVVFHALVERALEACLEAHSGQLRKASLGTPYAVHPLHMALALARLGSEPEVVAAALLHDAVEDSEDWSLARVESEFGGRVAGLVGELTEDKTRPWAERKTTAIEGIASLSPDAATIKAADHLHNLGSLRRELAASETPDQLWAHFRGGREGTLDVARRKTLALARRVEPRLARGLEAALEALEEACAARQG